MELLPLLISTIALIFAINANSKTKKLEEENKELRKLLNYPLDEVKEQKVVQQHVVQPARQLTPLTPIQRNAPPSTISKPPKQSTNMENMVGKNVIGIVATILIFIGIIAFGTLVFTSLTDGIKIFSMFFASFAVSAFGLWREKKNPSVFTNCLSGCGIGMIFISIFITHLYFGAINDIVTFVLVFLWSIAVSVISKKFKLQSLAYIALTGCIISSIFSLMYGITVNKFVEITIYHILTFVLLIIANKDNKALFQSSSMASIVLNIILGIIIQSSNTIESNPSYLILCFILGIYNMAICAMQYRSNNKDNVMDMLITTGLHYLNLAFSFFTVFEYFIHNVWFNLSDVATIVPIDTQSIAHKTSLIFFTLSALTAIISNIIYHFTTKEKEKKTYILIASEILIALITLFTPIEVGNFDGLGFIMPLAIINLFAYNYFKNRDIDIANKLYTSGFAFLITDCITSLFFIFEFATFGIFYSLALLTISALYFYSKHQNILHFPFMQTAVLNIHLLCTLLNFCEYAKINFGIGLLIIVFMNMAFTAYKKFTKQEENEASKILTEIAESILAFIISFAVLPLKEEAQLTALVLSTMLIPFALIRIKDVMDSKNSFMSVWYGLKFTFYTFMTAETFANLSDQQFILSIFFMVIAALCIIFGFMKELKSLRIYGLVLIMTSVFKMVVIDVWNQESLIRVVSLILGGIICFVISAIYSKVEKRQLHE